MKDERKKRKEDGTVTEKNEEGQRIMALPIMLNMSFPRHCGCSSMNCSMAISLRGIPFSRSKRSIPRSGNTELNETEQNSLED